MDTEQFIKLLNDNDSEKLSKIYILYEWKKNIKFDQVFNTLNQKIDRNHSENHILGYIYHLGLGLEKDYQKAKEYYELSANQGNSYAQNNLGYLYCNGLGLEKDVKKAKYYYELSTNQGSSSAKDRLNELITKDRVDIYLKNRKIKKENEKLTQENKRLQLEIDYRPGGEGYLKAEEDFYQNCDKQKN